LLETTAGIMHSHQQVQVFVGTNSFQAGNQLVISFGPLCNGKECDPLLLKPMMDSFWNLTYDEQAVS